MNLLPGLFAFVLLMLLLKNPADRRRSDIFKWGIWGAVGIGIVGLLLPWLFILAVLGIAGYLVYDKLIKDKDKDLSNENGWDAKSWDEQHQNTRTYEKYREMKEAKQTVQDERARQWEADWQAQKARQQAANTTGGQQSQTKQTGTAAGSKGQGSQYQNATHKTGAATKTRQSAEAAKQATRKAEEQAGYYYAAEELTSNVKKRRKIVAEFDKKYGLFLTDEQITSIVNSSYMSEVWKQEIVDMNKKYNVVQEWYVGPTAWLRVYIHAFHIQDITSDISQQEDIVMYAFETIFKYVDELGPMSMEQRIRRVNDKFMTDFDDIGFMVAYNFLQSKGLEHKLEREDILYNTTEEDTVDALLKKYESAEASEGTGAQAPAGETAVAFEGGTETTEGGKA